MKTPLTGILPVAPTPFHADGSIDPDGMCRVLDCMIDQGVDAICILANYSEQFLFSDEDAVVDASATRAVAGAWGAAAIAGIDTRRSGYGHWLETGGGSDAA